jgi:mRNA interferase YafQ
MRRIEQTTQFRKDYKRELRGRYQSFLDCHINPDLILIYEKPNAEILRLIRVGSHSELSL